MSVSEIINLSVSAIVALTSLIVSFVISKKKNKETKASAIFAKIVDYVSQAEQIFGDNNGTAKKQWVIQKTQLDCMRANIEIGEELISNQIESILESPQKKAVQEAQNQSIEDNYRI